MKSKLILAIGVQPNFIFSHQWVIGFNIYVDFYLFLNDQIYFYF